MDLPRLKHVCLRRGKYSSFYKLSAGVRQGGSLFPYIFAIFIDGIVDKSKMPKSVLGCYVSTSDVASIQVQVQVSNPKVLVQVPNPKVGLY